MMKALPAATLAAAFALPAHAAPEKYVIDPTHTFPSLEFPHMGISVWRGKFDRTSGSITLDRTAKTGSVDVVIDAASINFGLAAMDEHAVGEDWFDVKKYPTAAYKGTIKFEGDKPAMVDGKLTFRGQTKPVPLTIKLFNCIEHPMLKKQVCGADATGTLNWGEWGMKHSEYAKGDMGKTTLQIQVEALKQ